MADKLTLDIPEDIELAAIRDFYPIYGIALAEWSRLENSLHFWFAKATQMQDKLSRSIFFSVRSFSGRADLLEAAISATDSLTANELAFLKAVVSKARKYSQFRNTITHCEARLNVNATNYIVNKAEFILIDGSENTPGAVRAKIQDIRNAANNFRALRYLAIEPHPALETKESLEQLLLQVLQLPIEASSDTPNASKPQTQPSEPGRVNKKEYRAQQKADRGVRG